MASIFKFEKKFGYAELFALIALILSGFAVWFGYLARQDAIILSGIELKPEIKVNANINKNKFKDLHAIIYNGGPVEALQLEVKLISHRYFEKLKGIKVSGTGSDTTFSMQNLEPLKSVAFKIPKHFLYVNAMLQEPKEHKEMGSNLLLALVISKQILYNSAYVTSIKNRISRCLVSYNEQGWAL